MRIIGPPTATQATVIKNMPKAAQSLFTTIMLPILWQEALRLNIDPVGMVAQSYKETGGGAFTGKVNQDFYNPCGLKVRHQSLMPGVTTGDNPLAHQMFPNWQTGCRAQAQHLRAYTGWFVPSNELIVDPRYDYVTHHRLENWAELGGNWAPSITYGAEIESMMRLLAVA